MKKILKKAAKLLSAALLCTAFGASGALAHSYTQEELAYMPATKQIELFKKGEVTPLEVLEAQIARVEMYNGPIKENTADLLDNPLTYNGKVNAICFEKFAEARAAAVEAELRYQNGTARPLEGITVGIKNENAVKGWRVDMGSILLKDYPLIEEDCAIIDKLKDAGAILAFSTTVPEFYISTMTWSNLYGVTRNPWNEYYGVGGSSGGSGASLAAGFCTLATGSDMGGSIRLPASMNGIYGFKAPFGRVPTSEIAYETLGPLARTFDDLVLMQNILCGPSPKVHSSLRPKLDYPSEYESLKGAKVVACYFSAWSDAGLDPDTREAMDKAVEALKKAGAEVTVIEEGFNVTKEAIHTYGSGLMSTQMYELVGVTKGQDQSLLSAYVPALFSSLGELGPERLIEADHLKNETHKIIQDHVFSKDNIALVMPTFVSSHVVADLDSSPEKKITVNGKVLPNSLANAMTPVWNLLCSYPVLDVPVHISSKNVPIGVQVVGNTYDDLAAFRVGYALSQNLPQNFEGDAFPDFRNEQ